MVNARDSHVACAQIALVASGVGRGGTGGEGSLFCFVFNAYNVNIYDHFLPTGYYEQYNN